LKAKEDKIENLRKELEEKEKKELTLRPKINKARNNNLFSATEKLTSGDHNIDLYQLAKLKERDYQMTSKDSKELNDLKECRFRPEVNKEILRDSRVQEIKGMDKIMKRMKKARVDAEFKKKMTERSEFSATVGVKKAKKIIKKVDSVQQAPFVLSLSQSKFTSFGKIDGSQINIPKKTLTKVVSTKERLPLYFPKPSPSTVVFEKPK